VVLGYTDWPHLAQVCRLDRIVTRKDKTSRELAYAVTSLPAARATPQELLALWRGHWGIENRVHWVRDVTFDEDRCQVRSGAAPQVLAACRNLVIGLLRVAGNANIAAALRRCATRYSYPLQLMGVIS
jgi:predicted transposase YbfD/YdcC